jgi:hypothetical protein
MKKKRAQEILCSFVNKSDLWKINIISRWREIIGETLSVNVKLLGINNGKMTIVAKNPCLSQELMMQRNQLMKKVNDMLSKPMITEIIIIVRR